MRPFRIMFSSTHCSSSMLRRRYSSSPRSVGTGALVKYVEDPVSHRPARYALSATWCSMSLVNTHLISSTINRYHYRLSKIISQLLSKSRSATVSVHGLDLWCALTGQSVPIGSRRNSGVIAIEHMLMLWAIAGEVGAKLFLRASVRKKENRTLLESRRGVKRSCLR